MIQWNKYFDKIWCINYIPYFKRQKLMEFELNRVGILNSGIFEWNKTFDSNWYGYLFNKLKEEKKCFCQNVNELKCTFAHYSCIKKSILNNHNRILILEDDERFLKNIDEIESILSNIPSDGDIILFDYSCMYKKLINEYRSQKINDYFSSFDKLNNAGCYMLSNKALNIFQQLYDNLILPADNYFHRFNYKKLNLNKYFSIKNMACQATFKKSMSFNALGINTVHNVYKAADLDYDKYMMRIDGTKYTYGDFIYEDI